MIIIFRNTFYLLIFNDTRLRTLSPKIKHLEAETYRRQFHSRSYYKIFTIIIIIDTLLTKETCSVSVTAGQGIRRRDPVLPTTAPHPKKTKIY